MTDTEKLIKEARKRRPSDDYITLNASRKLHYQTNPMLVQLLATALEKAERALEEADKALLDKSTEVYVEGMRCWLCFGEAPKGVLHINDANKIEHEPDCPVPAARSRQAEKEQGIAERTPSPAPVSEK